jgi:serine phosphatase RsbU (regulator of sigma subunit)
VPLGALRFGGHEVLTATLEPGDLLLAYSDGAVDAVSPEGEFFGEERLMRALGESPPEPAAALNWVIEALEGFTRGHTPYDDVTLIVTRRIG